MLILIAYEPATGKEDRTTAIEAVIGQHGRAHIEPIKSLWIVDSAEELVKAWEERIGGPGKVLIVRIDQRATMQGYLPLEAWTWVIERLQR